MNWLPSLPTDSLHKYLALHGLWFVYGILALLAYLYYQNFEFQEFNKKESWLISKQDSVSKFKARIESVKNGRLTENTLAGISGKFKPKDEIILLNNAIILNESEIANLSAEVKQKPKSLFPLLEYIHIDFLLCIFMAVGLIFSVMGFSGWFKIQRISDEILKQDLELKRLQLNEEKRYRIKNRQ